MMKSRERFGFRGDLPMKSQHEEPELGDMVGDVLTEVRRNDPPERTPPPESIAT